MEMRTAGSMPPRNGSTTMLKLLIFMMFAAFAMTTDSVGTVIPQIIREYQLGMTAAGSFHYATMSGIGLSAIGLGFLADKMGRKWTILMGLSLFCISSALVATGSRFGLFVMMLFVSGLGIGIFKSGALALIGDISTSTREHAQTMNLVEGFFGVGAIIGPAIVSYALLSGATWKWVYIIAALLCLILIAGSLMTPFPRHSRSAVQETDTRSAFSMLGDPIALFFALLLMLYVGAEAAIYVWAPTYFSGYSGENAWLTAYVVSIFFLLRAAGRFVGSWLLRRLDWTVVLVVWQRWSLRRSCWAGASPRWHCPRPACSCPSSIRRSTRPASTASIARGMARSRASSYSLPASAPWWRRSPWRRSAT